MQHRHAPGGPLDPWRVTNGRWSAGPAHRRHRPAYPTGGDRENPPL